VIDKDLIKIISESLNLKNNQVNDETEMQNTKEWDSLNHVKIIIALSKKFNVKIQTSDYDKLTSFKSIKNFLNKKIN
jgi:acyl carrier protein